MVYKDNPKQSHYLIWFIWKIHEFPSLVSSKALLTPAAELAALAVAELLHYDATATKNATGFGGICWGKMVEIP